MPAATSAVMDVLPRERAGAGSALTNTARQVGVALGTAVLGSILAQAYHSALSPTLNHLPATARGAAGGSIEATQAVAARLGSAGHFLLGPANDAFVSAMHVTTLVAAAISLAGALVVLRWMPGRPRTVAVMDTLLPETPAEVITEGAPVAVSTAAAPARGAFEAAPPAGLETALDAATGPGGIDPMEALDVWQENLSARSPGGER
jgi:hypothetical protein